MKKLIGILLVISFFYGCSELTKVMKKSSEISVSPNYHFNKYKRITVFPFNTTKPERYNLTISDQLSICFMKLGYTVVERTQLQALLKELNIEVSGFMKQSDIIRIGKLLQIDAIIMGSLEYDNSGGYWWLRSGSMRMIDVTTGELVMSIYSNAYNKEIEYVVDDIVDLIKEKGITKL